MHASAATAVKDFHDESRARLFRIDPLMLLATVVTLGFAGFALIFLGILIF